MANPGKTVSASRRKAGRSAARALAEHLHRVGGKKRVTTKKAQLKYLPNEQITYILEGALKFWIDGKEIVVNAGEVLTIPPHMPHKAEALVDTVDLDVFNPPREDWISKTDKYLRGSK